MVAGFVNHSCAHIWYGEFVFISWVWGSRRSPNIRWWEVPGEEARQWLGPRNPQNSPKGAVFVAWPPSFLSYHRPQLAGLRGSLLNVPFLPGNNGAQDTPKTSSIIWFFTDELISRFSDNHLLPKAFLRSGVGWGVWMWPWTPGFSSSSGYISLRHFLNGISYLLLHDKSLKNDSKTKIANNCFRMPGWPSALNQPRMAVLSL